MKKILGLLLCLPLLAQAEYLHISNAWVRAAPPNVKVMVAYATVKNSSEYTIWITAAESERFNSVEIHETIEENGMASMVHLGFVRLEPGQTAHFEPGGKHLMLFTAQNTTRIGDYIPFNLVLGNGDRESFTAVVSRDEP